VPLANKHSGVMDTPGHASFKDLSLQSPLHEIFNLQGQHVIQSHPGFIQHTDANQTTNEGIAFKQTFGILCLEL
jgi:hypothetical protein